MTVIEVKDKKTKKAFLDVARLIYKNDPNWVCPLDNNVEAVFDPEKNNFHKHGKCIRWILTDDSGRTIGRIAAFINDKKAWHYDQPTGGIGFFECINDQKAAFLLFDTAKQWLQANDMKAMDGPINFGENDTFWGLLIEGFPGEPLVMIAGLASIRDADIQANIDRYLPEISNYWESFAAGYPWAIVREGVHYWSRIIIDITPVRIWWWDDGLAAATRPHRWDAPADVAAPPSDPAPQAPSSAAPDWSPKSWSEQADEVVAAGLPAHLTLLDPDGFPLPFRVRSLSRNATGFSLAPVPAEGVISRPSLPRSAFPPLRAAGCRLPRH